MKTKTSQTPGAWHWDNGDALRSENGELINGMNRPPLERQANRLLIAAAPELLACLRVIANDARNWLDNELEIPPEDLLQAIRNIALEAILKAEGSDE